MTGKAKKPPTDAQMKARAIARWNNEGGAPASGDVSVRKRPKRPRDANQLAKSIVDLVTDEDRQQKTPQRTAGPYEPANSSRRPKKAK